MDDFVSRLHSLLSSEEVYSRMLRAPESLAEYLEQSQFADPFMRWICDELVEGSSEMPQLQPTKLSYLRAASMPFASSSQRPGNSIDNPKTSAPGSRSAETIGALEKRLDGPLTPSKYGTIGEKAQPSKSSARPTEKRRIALQSVDTRQSIQQGISGASITPQPPISALTSQHAGQVGLLLGSLIVNKAYPMSRAVQLLMRLLSRSPSRTRASAAFSREEDVSLMLSSALNLLSPLLLVLGPQFLRGFVRLEFFRTHQIKFIELARQTIAEESSELMSVSKVDDSNERSYIRPFSDDVDNRNDYKLQFDALAYNERERSYDSLSNLFREYLQASKEGDTALVYLWSRMAVECPRLLDMLFCNMDWFCAVFADMLLFYCTNSVKISLDTGKTAAETQVNIIPEETRPPLRQRPINNLSRNRKPASSRTGVKDVDVFAGPGGMFSGPEQFFFRFIVLSNNYRFSSSLELELNDMLFRLTSQLSENSDDPSSSFAEGILKLKVLGRFYGLVLFYTQWTLPLVDDQGMIGRQLQKSAARKMELLSRRLSFEAPMKEAGSIGNYAVIVPWVVEALKLLKWNIFWSEIPFFVRTLHSLYQLKMSNLFSLNENRFSYRR